MDRLMAVNMEKFALEARLSSLREALEKWHCILCNGRKEVPLWRYEMGTQDALVTCRTCDGTGLSPIARDALTADAALREKR
jgi:hypothetical protein